MFDTHAHLNMSKYNTKLDKIYENARNNNVKEILVVGMDLKTSIRAIEIANTYPNTYASVGIHPAYVNESNH